MGAAFGKLSPSAVHTNRDPNLDVEIPLLPVENGTEGPLFSMGPGISAFNFYEGRPSADYLRERVAQIVAANPWLSGRVVTLKSGKPGLAFASKPEHRDLSSCFVDHGKLEGVTTTTTYSALIEAMEPHSVGTGKVTLDKNVSLFKVSLFELEGGNSGLMLSISHVLVDGQGFYQVVGMLDPSAKVISLQPGRKQSMGASILDLYPKEKAMYSSYSFLAGLIRNMLVAAPHTFYLNHIQESWLQQGKAQYQQGRGEHEPEFISSNDLITSWVFRHLKADLGSMIVNMRGKMPGLDEQDAGNYETALSYTAGTYETPGSIRATLQALMRFPNHQPNEKKMPGKLQRVSMCYAMVSSWVSLYQHIELPGTAAFQLHLPVVSLASVRCLGGGCFTFRPAPGKVAMLLYTREADVSSAGACPFGDPVMQV
ncbi:unnamed protein product [Chrysoparadoxa australica]